MISFKIITMENKEQVVEELSKNRSPESRVILHDIMSGLDIDNEGDIEFAVCVCSGCALVRIFDMGRYMFAFPYEICESADVHLAIDSVREYAMREEISLTFTDVPAEYLSYFRGFRHMDMDAEDEDAESYRVRIKTECELIDEVPEITRERVELSSLREDDIQAYAVLCKDKNVNKYWGYDYTCDVKEPSDSYFFENAMIEFSSGVSMSMAVRCDGCFAGEAVIYAFDGKGGAEFAIRLLPEWQGGGLGTETVRALSQMGKNIGLVKLYSKIMKENKASISMLKKITDEYKEDDGCVTFTIYLN